MGCKAKKQNNPARLHNKSDFKFNFELEQIMTNELKAAQRDAERYRYWRNKYSEKFGDADLTPENFDSVTDAQMLMASALTQPVVAETQALEAIRKAAQSVLDDFDYGYPREYLELGQVRQLAEFCLASQSAPTSVAINNDRSLDIHIKGRCLPQVDKEPLALLYSDTVNDQMVRRDDLWIATTGQLAPQPAPDGPTTIIYNHLKEIYGFLADICPDGIADEAFRNVPDSVLPYSERPTLLPYNTRQGNAPGECPGFARQDSEIGGRVNGALKAAPAVAPTNPTCSMKPIKKDALTDLIKEHLKGTLHCTADWSLWLSDDVYESDFKEVCNSDAPLKLADAILNAFSSHPAPAVAVGPDALLVKIHFAAHLRRPFIYESVGRINLEEFDEIIAQAMKNQTEIFTKGGGDYTLKMTYFSGQYGPDGRCEYAPGWEFDFVAFAILTVPEGVKS